MTTDTPAADTPAADTPAADTPAADTPAADRRLDGNALAGPLRELFAVDLSGATATCATCGSTGPLGEQSLYADAPALVLRCRDCTGVLLRYAADGDVLRADFSGLLLLVAPAGGPA